MNKYDELAIALLKACGFDDVSSVRGVTFEHWVGGRPELTVVYNGSVDIDGVAVLSTRTVRFGPLEVQP